MVNQLLGMSKESEIEEMARLFSDFVDGCLSLPINLPFFAYHTAMKVQFPVHARRVLSYMIISGSLINRVLKIFAGEEDHREQDT